MLVQILLCPDSVSADVSKVYFTHFILVVLLLIMFCGIIDVIIINFLDQCSVDYIPIISKTHLNYSNGLTDYSSQYVLTTEVVLAPTLSNLCYQCTI